MKVIDLLNPRNLRLPSPMRMLRGIKDWVVHNGVWWAGSVVGHAIVLSSILLLLGSMTSPPKEGDAPLFEAKLDTEIAAPQLDHFEVGETPIEPTELNTDTLSLVDAPQIETPAGDPDAAASGGGSAPSPSGGIGGLDQFAVKALGPGPLVRGSGTAAAGSGRSPGSGGAGSGFGARGDKDARRAMVGGYGGTKGTERAVAAALNWLARHQSPDGSWSIDGYQQMCKGDACSGAGDAKKADAAATAMGLLPFLAAGQTHQSKGPYRQTVYGGLKWLINHQGRDGNLLAGSNMYAHGLAAITLCEAYGLTKDSYVGAAAQAAIRFIEESPNPATGGWHYSPKPETVGDTSIVGWQVMALKSAQMAGLEVGKPALAGAQKWLRAVARGDKKGLFCYNPVLGPTDTMTSVGLLCTQYLGAKRDDPPIQEGMAYLMSRLPKAEARNCYYWYYATQVMHNLPGPEWDTWNRQMRRVLIESQIKDGCAAGSWDPINPTPDPWQKEGGRVFVTSLCCLTLEVYYRYLPLYTLDTEEKLADSSPPKKSAAKKEKATD
jgi:hypothetical protein